MSLGKLKVDDPYIDYTEVAIPLSAERIHDDITEMHIQFRDPVKLVMWEHQWDWLVKQIESAGATAATEPIPTFWGVPVEVRK